MQTLRDYFLRVLAFVGAMVIWKYFVRGEVDQDIPAIISEAFLIMLFIVLIKQPGVFESYKRAKEEARTMTQSQSEIHN